MNRRSFVSGVALSLPALSLGSLANGQTTRPPQKDASRIQAVKDTMLSMQRAPWEQGTALHALMEIRDNDNIVRLAHEAVLRQNADGRLALMGGGNTLTDPISPGPGVLRAYEITGDEKYKKAAEAAYRFCIDTKLKAPNGALFHFTNSQQCWSDSIFMAPPFFAYYGDFDQAILQVEGYRSILFLPEKQMYGHKWDQARNEFTRRDCWGSGNGWAAAGITIIVDLLPTDRTADRLRLAGYVKEVLDGCLKHIRPDGLFHDVVDNPDTFVETNLSQMLAFAVFRGVQGKWLDKTYLSKGMTMYEAALKKLDKYGFVQDACGSPRFDSPGVSTEAQAFHLMMQGALNKIS